jgi:hypothetical protein
MRRRSSFRRSPFLGSEAGGGSLSELVSPIQLGLSPQSSGQKTPGQSRGNENRPSSSIRKASSQRSPEENSTHFSPITSPVPLMPFSPADAVASSSVTQMPVQPGPAGGMPPFFSPPTPTKSKYSSESPMPPTPSSVQSGDVTPRRPRSFLSLGGSKTLHKLLKPTAPLSPIRESN